MKLSQLVNVLQQHLAECGDIAVGIRHDKVMEIFCVSTVEVECENKKFSVCLFATELGNAILDAEVARTEAHRALEKVKGK